MGRGSWKKQASCLRPVAEFSSCRRTWVGSLPTRLKLTEPRLSALASPPQVAHLGVADGAVAHLGGAVIESVEKVVVRLGEGQTAATHDGGRGREGLADVAALLELAVADLAKRR